jgi:ABC-type Zn2+ transport system substrate-binding protein/surface adhesin
LAYKEINHNAFDSCVSLSAIPGTCLQDGNTRFHTTWAVEINYYMDLGFLPENAQFFSISGRAGFYGPKGDSNAPLQTNTPSKTEINSEPIRLTFDASKAVMGSKYSHFVDVWVAYRYWQNKFGLDHNGAFGVCTQALGGAIVSTNSCTEQTVYTGVTVKF